MGKGEWLEDINHGDNSSKSFVACVEECISEKCRKFDKGLNIKVTLDIYIQFVKGIYRI